MKKIRWSEEEIKTVKDNWLFLSIDELQRLLPNRTKRSIAHIAERKLNFNIRKPTSKRYKVNDNFFSNINPIASYYAGFIAADGSIDIDKNTFINRLNITQVDKKVLELFVKLIHYNGKIQTRVTKPGKLVKVSRIINVLRISSTKITEDLINNYNIVPNKTLILKPPQNLDYYNQLCYIIGIIDGDGSISLSKRGFINMSLVGTKEICEWVKIVLDNVGTIRHKHNCHENIYQLGISHNQSLKIIRKLRSIKELENIRFARKWDKILEWEQLQSQKVKVA